MDIFAYCVVTVFDYNFQLGLLIQIPSELHKHNIYLNQKDAAYGKRYIKLNGSGDSGILSQIHYVPAGLALFNVIILTDRE